MESRAPPQGTKHEHSSSVTRTQASRFQKAACELIERGLDFTTPRLYILDGGKALQSALERQGRGGFHPTLPGAQETKRHRSSAPEEHQAEAKRKLQNAYAMVDYGDAKRALDNLHRELMHINPGAARSLEEGLEETLTVHRLGVPEQLRRTLSSTNVRVLHRGDGVSQREALAPRRSD